LIFAGSASPRLTAAICRELGVKVGASEVVRFSEGTLFVRVLENVRGRSVYLVQSTVFPTNANFMELLFWIDAFSRASADSVTVVVPYFSYAKGDKKDEPRVSIRARVCADAIEAAGADRVVTLDLHAPQIQGFFRIPVDDLYAMPYLCAAIERESLRDPVVVSPDAGFAKRARRFAHRLGAPLAIADKVREGHGETAEIVEIIGEVADRDAIIVDDFTISAGTAGRGGQPAHSAWRALRYRCRHARRLRGGIDGAPRPQPDRASDRHGLDRDAARRVLSKGGGRLGCAALRGGDRPDPPPREHQRPLPGVRRGPRRPSRKHARSRHQTPRVRLTLAQAARH